MLPFLDPVRPVFPHPETALTDPDGLLAAGGNLNVDTLVDAYRHGIFPWYEEGQPILWWSPASRAVLRPGSEHTGRTMAKVLARDTFRLTTNHAFEQVVAACSGSRRGAAGTWITAAMIDAYQHLHRVGIAHSLECWRGGKLVGGLYGLRIGGLFCGESMFSHVPNASKAAFIALSRTLARRGFALIDCQIPNPHLDSLGVATLPRRAFLTLLNKHRDEKHAWPDDDDFAAALTVVVS
ncbi:MAG: leucyl/phenylalanyl-tRNA--protein transferase [Bacteroidales bacterium]|nr:leucyl/phenylalanyl-tRNA--protein transferase [Bacteroidales bacterium]